MSSAYAVPLATSLPPHLTAHVIVQRKDERDLTTDDLATAEALFPAPPEEKAEVYGQTKPKARAKSSKKPPSAKTASPKRKAAKRPTRR